MCSNKPYIRDSNFLCANAISHCDIKPNFTFMCKECLLVQSEALMSKHVLAWLSPLLTFISPGF